MKRKKTEGIVFIYETLISGGIVNKRETADKLGVSEKTISRYISDLKSYFLNENKQEYIKYSRETGGYILETKKEDVLTKKDILAISKVLLESRGFNKEEITQIIEKLLQNCVYKDKAYIRQVISNELHNYVEPKHGGYLVDKLWDLSEAIRKQRKVKIEYTKIGIKGDVEINTTKRILRPEGILFSEYYFYLIAQIDGKDYENPAIYRLDRIKNYRILDEGFEIKYQDRFKEGEFRKHIQFMQSGKLQTIKFKFKGESVEAVLDRLPTAEILDENDGEYLIEAEIFGRGIKMWLLSQGDAIEVIEPKEFRYEMKNIIKSMLNVYELKNLNVTDENL